MDEERAIRFAIPPFFLIGWLLCGAYLGGCNLSSIFTLGMTKELLGVLAATAVVFVPLGYLIGTVSVKILRLLALVSRTPSYEIKLSHSALERIWGQLGSNRLMDKRQTIYAGFTFDHELLNPGVHKWIVRRWNAFYVAANSIVALLLAHDFAPFLSIPQTCKWWASTAILASMLFVQALCTWRETMRMIEFQSHRTPKPQPPPSESSPTKNPTA